MIPLGWADQASVAPSAGRCSGRVHVANNQPKEFRTEENRAVWQAPVR
jgi:hypothetical protein